MNKSKTIYTNTAVANLYSSYSFSASIVSQAILWEKLYILEEKENFYHVAGEDDYRGWIHKTQVAALYEQNFKKIVLVTLPFLYFRRRPDAQSPIVRSAVAGSALEIIKKEGAWAKCIFPDGIRGWVEDRAFSAIPELNRENLIRYAKSFIGTPYFWGGKTAMGFDCSGFVQFVHKMFGIVIRRDAFMQFDDAKFISKEFLKAQTGDLCFFSEDSKNISHVAFYMDEGKVLHARGMIKINSLQKNDNDFDAELLSTFVAVKSFL